MSKTTHDQLATIFPDITQREIAEVQARDALRQAIKSQQPQMLREVSRILFWHDPENLACGREDAFEGEAATIVSRLRDGQSAADVSIVVREEFANWGLSVPDDQIERIALDIANLAQRLA